MAKTEKRAEPGVKGARGSLLTYEVGGQCYPTPLGIMVIGQATAQANRNGNAGRGKEAVMGKEIIASFGTKKGEELARLLDLHKKRNGRYATDWGDKTAFGLYETVKRFIADARNQEKLYRRRQAAGIA